MPGILSRVGRIWRNHIAGPKLRTYDAACEELGGAPWRQVPEATDRWFLADQRPKSSTGPKDTITDKVPTLDSFVIKKPMSDGSKMMLLGGAALTAIALAVVGLVAPSRAPSLPAAVVAPPIPAPATTAPAIATPTTAAPSVVASRAAAPTVATPVLAKPSAPVVTTRATVAPTVTRPNAAAKRRIALARHRRH
jgi:hypothetical protein